MNLEQAPNLTIRQVWHAWHVRKLQEAERAFMRTKDYIESVSLLTTIDAHRAAIHHLDREAESADRQRKVEIEASEMTEEQEVNAIVAIALSSEYVSVRIAE